MARLQTTGFEAKDFSGCIEDAPLYTSSTVPSFTNGSGTGGAHANETSIVHTAGASNGVSRKYTTGGSGGHANTIFQNVGTLSAAQTRYYRAYLYFANIPTTAGAVVRVNAATSASSIEARLTSGGKLQLWCNNSQSGSDSSATITTGQWYRVEIKCVYSSTQITAAELQLDGVSVATASSLTISSSNQWYVGWIDDGMGNSIVCYADDIAVNDDGGSAQNSWPGAGNVVLLLPISDNSAGSWKAGSGASASSNGALYDAINNTPPTGIASPDGVTNCISNAVSGATNPNGDFNMTSYTTAGIGASDTINCLTMVITHGEDGSTGVKTGTFTVLSNPAQGGTDTVGWGNSSQFGSTTSGAVGTYPTTTWITIRGTTIYAPSVTLGTSPVCRITKTDTGTRAADVCFMGLWVDYTPGVSSFSGDAAVALSPLASSESGTLEFTGTGSNAESPLASSASGFAGFLSGDIGAALSPLASSASGKESFDATGSAALSPLGNSASASLTFAATASSALSALASSVAGTEDFTATASEALSPLASSASGAEAFSSTGSAALSPLASSVSGKEEFAATAGLALSTLTNSASGTLDFSATATEALSPLAVSSSGAEEFSATASAALSPLAASASGTTEISGFAGSADLALSPLASSASGDELFMATSSTAVSSLTTSASGAEQFSATATAALSPFASSASATLDFTVTGSVALSPLGSSLSGTEAFTATASAALSSLAESSSGFEEFIGSGSTALSPLASSATGVADVGPIDGTIQAAIRSLAVSAVGTYSGPVVPTIVVPGAALELVVGAEAIDLSHSAPATLLATFAQPTLLTVQRPKAETDVKAIAACMFYEGERITIDRTWYGPASDLTVK